MLGFVQLGEEAHILYAELIEVMRLIAAALLGGVIGLERQQRHKSAGLRTHILDS